MFYSNRVRGHAPNYEYNIQTFSYCKVSGFCRCINKPKSGNRWENMMTHAHTHTHTLKIKLLKILVGFLPHLSTALALQKLIHIMRIPVQNNSE